MESKEFRVCEPFLESNLSLISAACKLSLVISVRCGDGAGAGMQ